MSGDFPGDVENWPFFGMRVDGFVDCCDVRLWVEIFFFGWKRFFRIEERGVLCADNIFRTV